MTEKILTANSEVSRDLSPEWLELSTHVRHLAAASGGDTPLARSAIRLCDHVERLHNDVQHLLDRLNTQSIHEAGGSYVDDGSRSLPVGKIDQENIQIQREMHQSSDLRQVVKALFMWKDDPTSRIKDRDG